MGLDEELIAAALDAARDAARLHRSEAGRSAPDRWSEKGAADFVTEVDREAERRIIARLRARFPGHVFLAEEGTDLEEGAGAEEGWEREESPPIRWIIDPLDGTTNWLHGYPEHAVSIAALDRDGLRAAVVINSATGEEFDAIRGGGSRRNGEPIRVSSVERLHLSLVGTGFPFKRVPLLPPYLAMLGAVLERSSGVRRAGAASLDLCDLACGRLDGFWELWLMPWDVAGGALVVREAGGVFEPLRLSGHPDLAATGAAATRFHELCAGSPARWAPAAGSYIAGNPAILPRLSEVVADALAPAPGG